MRRIRATLSAGLLATAPFAQSIDASTNAAAHETVGWSSPLVVAVLAAAVAALGNALVAIVNGRQQRNLEDRKRSAELALEQSKAESARILEMIKTGDAEHAATNLQFLLDSGLITDPNLTAKLSSYLETREPGSGPFLASPSGRVAFEPSNSLPETLKKNLDATLSRYFDYLDRIGFPKPAAPAVVAVQHMPDETANAYYYQNRIVIDERLADDPVVALREYNHHLLTEKWTGNLTPAAAAIESGLADYFACSFLDTPHVGEKAVRVFKPDQPYIRTLENKRPYQPADIEDFYAGAEIWGGFCWDIRKRAGAEAADKLIASVWQSLATPADAPAITQAFVDKLLAAAEARGKPVLDAVRSAADERKLPHS